MKLTLRSKPALLFPLTAFLLCASALPQRPTYPLPPKPLDNSAAPPTPGAGKRPIDFIQLQKEAEALSQIAQTIPADLTSIRKGLLPKDTVQKLKQIEKLSKHLRTELNP